jgi:hypothetical protein
VSGLNSPESVLAVGSGLTDLRLEYRKVTARITEWKERSEWQSWLHINGLNENATLSSNCIPFLVAL